MTVTPRRAVAAFVLGATATLVGGCANGADLPPPGADEGRGALAGLRLGTSRDAALAALAGRFAPPRCTFSRLAPVGSRKAFPTERCEHGPDASGAAPVLAGGDVERLVTRFVDDTLVRVDAVFAPTDAAGASRGPSVDALGEPASARASGAPRWTIGSDELWLIDGADGRADELAGRPRLVLIDAGVARALPALADDLPSGDGSTPAD